MNMEKYIVIKDGTSKSQLMKAIENYESIYRSTVLKIYVHENHNYSLVDFDGISITKWGGVIDDFINNVTSTKELIDMF